EYPFHDKAYRLGTLTQRHGHLIGMKGERVESVYCATMGFNRRKMEDQRRDAAEKEAATRRATDAQVLEDAERLIAVSNERDARALFFSPGSRAAIAAGYWFLWAHCPACRTINAIACEHSTVTPTRQ